jgi:hypothetical protein
LNNSSLGFYCNAHVDGTYADMGAIGTGVTNVFGLSIYSGTAAFDAYDYTGSGRVSNAAADTSGFFIGSRTSNVVSKLFRNGSQIGSTLTSTAGGLPTSSTIYLLAQYDVDVAAPNAVYFTAREYSLFFIGTGLSDAEVSAFNTAVAAWVAAT